MESDLERNLENPSPLRMRMMLEQLLMTISLMRRKIWLKRRRRKKKKRKKKSMRRRKMRRKNRYDCFSLFIYVSLFENGFLLKLLSNLLMNARA